VNAVTSMRTIAVGHDVSTRELITIPGVSNARISSQAKPQFFRRVSRNLQIRRTIFLMSDMKLAVR